MTFSREKIEELEARVKKMPGSPAFARLADYYRSMGQVDNAITLCEKGVKQNADYPTGHLLLGRCYFEKERVEEAITEFQAVLKLDPRNIFALKIMGDISAQKGNNSQAAQYYKRAAESDPLNTSIQDMFRRFERYYKAPGPLHTDGASPAKQEASLSETGIIDEVATQKAVESAQDILAADPDFSAPETAAAESPASEDLSSAVSFDDLDQGAAPETGPAPVSASVDFPERVSESAEISPPDSLVSLEEQLGLAPHSTEEKTPEEITEDEAIKVGEAHADVLEPVAEEAEPAAEKEEEPEPRPPASVSTEMVDLPPEMTGGSREERVGEFKVRKSIMDRLIEEQSGLLETTAKKPETGEEAEASSETEPAPEAAPVRKTGRQKKIPAAARIKPPEEKAPPPTEVSNSAPGMDGYYNVSGEASIEQAAGTPAGAESAALSGIDDVEMTETIDEESISAVPVEEQSQADIEELLTPATEYAAAEPPPAGVSESAVAAARVAEVPEAGEKEDDVQALLQEIDADDSLKNFVTAAAEEKPKPARPEPKTAPMSPQTPEILEETKTEKPADAEISSSAPGMDGFYSVSGDTASAENADLMAGIDHVEMSEAVSEDTLHEVPEAALPAAADTPVELGNDVEIDIPEVPDSAPEVNPPASEQTAETAAPGEEQEKKEPRKKNEKGKTKTLAKVVSNVATTSLAEIYLRQGHKEQALAVYKKIQDQNPDNKRIQSKIEKLEKEIEEQD